MTYKVRVDFNLHLLVFETKCQLCEDTSTLHLSCVLYEPGTIDSL